MSKRRKVGILLIIIGAFIPSVLYPLATLTTNATFRTIAFATARVLYKPRLNDLEIVLRKSDKPHINQRYVFEDEPKKDIFDNLSPDEPERNPYLDVGIKDKKVAIPYNYTVALGITIAFLGISFVALSRKKKV